MRFRKKLAHREKLAEDRSILSAAKMYPNNCSFWQFKVYADIRGVPWRRGVKRQWGNRKPHLRKLGQHYYIVLFSPLSPFHWPQNIWPWMAALR